MIILSYLFEILVLGIFLLGAANMLYAGLKVQDKPNTRLAQGVVGFCLLMGSIWILVHFN